MGYRSTYNRRLRAARRLKRRLAVASLLGVAICAAALLMLGEPLPLGNQQSQHLAADAAPLQPPSQAVAAVVTPARAGARPIYPYSIVPGGVAGRAELLHVLQTDQVVARHYAGLQVARISALTVSKPRAVYVSYRKGDQVFWTAKKVMLAQGETLLSDGSSEIRTRCGNRISDLPRLPVEANGPSGQVLDTAMNMDMYADDADAAPSANADATDSGASSSGAGGAPDASQPPYQAGSAYGSSPAPAYPRAPAGLALLGMSGMMGGAAPSSQPDRLASLPPMVSSAQTGEGSDPNVSSGTPGTSGATGTSSGSGTGGTPGTPSGATPAPGADAVPSAGGGAASSPVSVPGAPAAPNKPPLIVAKAGLESAQVPEPGSLWLSGAALAVMLLLRRKTRRPRRA